MHDTTVLVPVYFFWHFFPSPRGPGSEKHFSPFPRYSAIKILHDEAQYHISVFYHNTFHFVEWHASSLNYLLFSIWQKQNPRPQRWKKIDSAPEQLSTALILSSDFWKVDIFYCLSTIYIPLFFRHFSSPVFSFCLFLLSLVSLTLSLTLSPSHPVCYFTTLFLWQVCNFSLLFRHFCRSVIIIVWKIIAASSVPRALYFTSACKFDCCWIFQKN